MHFSSKIDCRRRSHSNDDEFCKCLFNDLMQPEDNTVNCPWRLNGKLRKTKPIAEFLPASYECDRWIVKPGDRSRTDAVLPFLMVSFRFLCNCHIRAKSIALHFVVSVATTLTVVHQAGTEHLCHKHFSNWFALRLCTRCWGRPPSFLLFLIAAKCINFSRSPSGEPRRVRVEDKSHRSQ